MRRKQLACALWLAGLTGCPHSFGRGGTIDRAVAKDARENLEQPQPKCTPKLLEELCPVNQEPSARCLQVCGAELEAWGDW
jgi:hypothetical protein